MGSPDDPERGESTGGEPPYRPWPGEQVPYTPTASFHVGGQDVQPPRRRRRWLWPVAALIAVVGVSTGALLFVGDNDHDSGDDGGVTSGEIMDDDTDTWDEESPSDDSSPTDEESPVDDYSPADEETPVDDESPWDEESPVDEPVESSFAALSTGDCMDKADSSSYTYFVSISCDELHDVQVLDVEELEDRLLYPGYDAIAQEADSVCGAAYDAAAQWWTSEEAAALGWRWVAPDSEEWDEGTRTLACLLENADGSYLDQDWLD